MSLLLALACTFVLEDVPCSTDSGDSGADSAADSGDSAADSDDSAVDTGEDTGEDTACETASLAQDADGDGFGDVTTVEERCPTEGWVAVTGDCDDSDADVFPGALERCNGSSDACDPAWTSDDGLATFTDATGSTDQTALLAGFDGAPGVGDFGQGDLALCGGTWFVNLSFTAGGEVRSVGDRAVLDGGGVGPVLALFAGDYVVSGIRVQHGLGVSGGGIVVDGGDSVELSDLEVQDNVATEGGGLYVQGGTVVTMADSLISGNVATASGGGIALSGAELSVTGSSIEGNEAGDNGGGLAGLAGAGSVVTLTASTLSGNHAVGLGAGVLAEDLSLVCVGDAATDGIGIFGNVSDTKRSEIRLEGRAATASGENCDLALEGAGALGVVSVEGVDDFEYGADATFLCDSVGCLP